MRDLAGKVAVVTGGASGIGRALAERFAAEGMRLVLADIERPVLDEAVAGLCDRGVEVIGVPTDVTSYDSVAALADAAYAAHGAVHVLCNNAGVGPPGGLVWETTPNDWRWTFGVNIFGVAHGIQAFVPRMLAAGDEGIVVNTSSPDGPIAPMPQASVYAASKCAVTCLTECLAAQLEAEGTALRAAVFYPSGRGLLDTGWSVGAIVMVRIGVAALIVLPFGLVALRGSWDLLRANLRLITGYGLMAVAGAQFCYFSAVQHMQVGPALLIEYTAPAPVALWMWLRHRQRPGKLTALGADTAAGLRVLPGSGGRGVSGCRDGDEGVGAVELLPCEEELCFISSDAQLLRCSAAGVRPPPAAAGALLQSLSYRDLRRVTERGDGRRKNGPVTSVSVETPFVCTWSRTHHRVTSPGLQGPRAGRQPGVGTPGPLGDPRRDVLPIPRAAAGLPVPPRLGRQSALGRGLLDVPAHALTQQRETCPERRHVRHPVAGYRFCAHVRACCRND